MMRPPWLARLRCIRLSSFLAFASASASTSALAQEIDTPRSLDPPAPPTLPALTHPTLSYTFEYTAARIDPKEAAGPPGPSRDAAYAWFAHSELEAPLIPRKWYIGMANDVAAAAIPGVGRAILLGNPEVWARGMWSSMLGLSAGGGLGIVLPAPRTINSVEREVLQAVRAVRPWDEAYFKNLTFTFRPSFDIRHVTHRLTVQLRQGIDWAIDSDKTDFVARATLYLGFRAHEAIGLGLELWEVYQLTANIRDDARAALALSPSVRFVLPHVEPALSLLLPVATPLNRDVDSYIAVRLNVGYRFSIPGEPAK